MESTVNILNSDKEWKEQKLMPNKIR